MEQSLDRNAFTIKQFCDSYGVSRSFVYLQINANRLNVRRAGKRVLILRQDAEAWAAALPKGIQARAGRDAA